MAAKGGGSSSRSGRQPSTPDEFERSELFWALHPVHAAKSFPAHSPTSSRMGLGAWHASCSLVGLVMKLRTRRQKAVPLVSLCLKSKAPGPAAKVVRGRRRGCRHELVSWGGGG